MKYESGQHSTKRIEASQDAKTQIMKGGAQLPVTIKALETFHR